VVSCLLIQGRCPAEYLALLPSHTARVITSARVASSARWICNRIRKWALSVRTCIRACTVVVHKAIPWLPLCTGCCSVPPWRRTLPSSRIRILVRVWTGMRPRCPGAVHSVTGWEDKPGDQGSVLERGRNFIYLWRKRVRILRMTRTTALVLKILRDILTVSVLQGSQVAPGVVNVLADTAEI
jgi:hypothetical protein